MENRSCTDLVLSERDFGKISDACGFLRDCVFDLRTAKGDIDTVMMAAVITQEIETIEEAMKKAVIVKREGAA
jgi:hypothetical protein